MARGGFRPGAGRKRKNPVQQVKPEEENIQQTLEEIKAGGYCGTDAKLFCESLLSDPNVDQKTKIQVANILLPYQHARKGEGAGKKQEKDEKAKAAGSGRFAPSNAPLRVVK